MFFSLIHIFLCIKNGVFYGLSDHIVTDFTTTQFLKELPE